MANLEKNPIIAPPPVPEPPVVVPEVDLFRGFTPDELKSFMSQVETVSFFPGEPILVAGDWTRALYVLTEGAVRIELPDVESIDGVIADLTPISIFGESSFFHAHPHSTSVRCTAATKALRLTREIIAQPAMDRYRGVEMAPGPDVQTDDEIDAFVRETVESTYHPCGSCRMGSDAMAVVDPELRVHGIAGLRVIDSSVFPTEPNGNLNAPTIMLAERGADMVRGRPLLPASNVEVGLAPGTGTTQRPGGARRPTLGNLA